MQPYTIDVAKVFSEAPFGRYRDDGKASGEAFREDILRPAMAAHSIVEIDIDGVRRGIGSSWLEEVFGGMVRKGVAATELARRVKIKSARQDYVDEIEGYIRGAESK